MNKHDKEEHDLPLGTWYGRTVYGNGIYNRSFESVKDIEECIKMWNRLSMSDCRQCRIHSMIGKMEWRMALLLKKLMELDKERYPDYYKWDKWEKGTGQRLDVEK